MNWQEFENKTRKIASFIWDRDTHPDEINGVRIDCVCEIRADYLIIIEITQENTLSKLRKDLSKFAAVKPFLLSKQIYAECYFVTENVPNISLVDTGKGLNVEVLSFESLGKKIIDYSKYYGIRSLLPFGSAIQQDTGKKDIIKYVPVEYKNDRDGTLYQLSDIAKLLQDSNKVILVGDYGTGKSRCIQELFKYLAEKRNPASALPIGIDLRSNWGTRRGSEIIRRHFDDLGLSTFADNVLRIMPKGGSILLLDGFDEIASQTWSDDPPTLKELRSASLLGVKDLIQNNDGGVLIAGRENYFNSNEEMYHCLGVSPTQSILIRCEDEFTTEQMEEYLKNITVDINLPNWLPKRPIICKIASDIDPNILKLLMRQETGEVEFWDFFIRAICDREAKINPTLDSVSIKRILCQVANITRIKPSDLGPITIFELNQAFQAVVGKKPSDESSIILQRLPTLIRVAEDSSERQFVDRYILDGLRAESLIEFLNSIINSNDPIFELAWINPLKKFGLTVVADYIDFTKDQSKSFMILNEASHSKNQILASDMLASLCVINETIDCKHLSIQNGHFYYLDLSDKKVSNITILDGFIENLDITNINAANVFIMNNIITNLHGISGPHGIPTWLEKNTIEHYTTISTTSRIKAAANISKQQKIFLTIIKKTFFQPGSGRKEEALLRGWGEQSDSKIANKIINNLVANGVLTKFKGDEGWVYAPNRSFSRRMADIRDHLTSSDDPLWKFLDNI